MMLYLLDTNAVIEALRGNDRMLARLREHLPSAFGLPAIVLHELHFGASKSHRAKENTARVDALQFEIVAFDREDARKAGEIRAVLAAAGTAIGPYEVLIAGQALARSLTLVTHNTREFERVPDLKIEDWQSASRSGGAFKNTAPDSA